MKWNKLGQVFCPNGEFSWMYAYASYPWAELIEGDLFRVYFSTRNKYQHSSVSSILLDLNSLSIVEVASTPILAKGEMGAFDDSGVSMSCITTVNNRKYLYYLGWNIMRTVPWRNTIGLAIENSNKEFERFSKAPVLGISHTDPFTLTYPFILKEEGVYKMWYGSSLFWGPKVEDTIHVIRYATSDDGINWERHDTDCLVPKYEGEFAIVKPFVLKEDGRYKMWYSYRVYENYYIGYADSSDGLTWTRKDEEIGISTSSQGWDSEMICYPFIFDHKGNRYMLYNGNGYGKTGFGLAILNQD